MARLPHKHTLMWNALSCHKCTELTIHAHVHSTPLHSLSRKTCSIMANNWTRSPSRLKSLRQSFPRSRNAYQFHLSYLSFSDSFEEILRRACEARLMENFTRFTRSLKEMLSVVRHMREDGRAGCVDAEEGKTCGKSIFTAVFWAPDCWHCFKSVDAVVC